MNKPKSAAPVTTDWKAKLSPERYKVLREKATEAPFSGELLHVNEEGMFVCGACGYELFSSDTKYDSGSGWPSFSQPVEGNAVCQVPDTSHGMIRTEVTCNNCGSHLGHVFSDGPGPAGERYCINSLALDFKPKKKT